MKKLSDKQKLIELSAFIEAGLTPKQAKIMHIMVMKL